VARLRAAFPAFSWGELGAPRTAAREYGLALEDVGDVAAIEKGVTKAIRQTTGRFPPSVGELVALVRAQVVRKESDDRRTPDWVNRSALDDAEEFLRRATTDEERSYALEHVRSIRARIGAER